MLRNILRFSKTCLSSAPRSFKLVSPLPFQVYSKPFYRNYSAAASSAAAAGIDLSQLLSEHQKHIRLMSYLSTKMDDPKNIRKADNKEWVEKGYLSQLQEYSRDMEIYDVADVLDLEGKQTPSGSWTRFKFPIAENKQMRATMQRLSGLRISKIMEIMDYVAVTVAYRYCKEEPRTRKVTMATASVNDMAIFENQITAFKDLYVTGYVTFAAKTSMEIRVDISHSEDPRDQVGAAYFMFVARDTDDYSKPYPVPELTFEGEDNLEKCFLRYQYGKKNKQRRIEFAAKSAFKVPPSSEESVELHNLFRKNQESTKEQNEFVEIQKTQREKLLLTHIADKNTHGKVFGGFVMKESLELAWVVAYLNGDGTNPLWIHIDDVTFLRPIPVGSIIDFRACVAYIEGSFINVQVTADLIKDNDRSERVFEVHITFSVKGQPKPVLPVTYQHGMLYLEGKRRVLGLLHK